MTEKILKLGGGNWVVGDRFWDREAELALLMERLEEGANLFIVAPEERLRTVLGPQLDLLAMDLLTEAAVVGLLTANAASMLARDHFSEDWRGSLRTALGVLAHDGYLVDSGGAYLFESGLLRDWWKARFEFGYVPVAKREA